MTSSSSGSGEASCFRSSQPHGWWSTTADVPMNPRLIGKPGVGKTTLAYAAGKALGRPRVRFPGHDGHPPRRSIVTPVVGPKGSIQYAASAIVSAMVSGGVASSTRATA